MKKYQRVTRQFRAENCLIVFHTEVIEAYIVLKSLPQPLNFNVVLPETVLY